MPEPAHNRLYRWLAEYYDQLFMVHLPWFEQARQTVLGRILPRVASACDLACGTGTMALRLMRAGIRMYGMALSPTMRRLARKKARRQRCPCA